MSALREVIRRHKGGRPAGVYSVCSAHPRLLEEALRAAVRTGGVALIESTANQVNQFGGYTGLRPLQFRRLVENLADSIPLPRNRILGDELIAERTADLCAAAEAAWQRAGYDAPLYVIGSEVPTPGGAHGSLDALAVTGPQAAAATIAAHRRAFERQGLHDAWGRVIALVAQPGVEFDHGQVFDYRPHAAAELSRSMDSQPNMVFEAHSTDYQAPLALGNLVRDHFAILKVGPAATFAMRESIWALAAIATELGLDAGDSLKRTMLAAMREDPSHWRAYYRDPNRQTLDLQFSLSDRIRYYWGTPAAQQALAALFDSLQATGIPLGLLSQYMPAQVEAVRKGRIGIDPRQLVLEGIERLLMVYARACDPDLLNSGGSP